jgi:hypothetical protein
MEKRGISMAMGAFITVVGIILFLIIIVIFFGNFPFTNTIDKAACKNSILQRATFNAGPIELGKTTIPLNCKTEKICITDSGEPCPEFPKETRKNPITKKEMNRNDDARIVTLDTISQSLYDCNEMLGEGRINFMPHETYEQNYCLICARIAFDNEAKENVDDITYGELYRHMEGKKDNNGNSYLNYVYPGWDNWETSKILFENIKKENPDIKEEKFEDWKIDIDQTGGFTILAMQQTSSRWESYAIGGGTTGLIIAGSVAIASGPVGLITAVGVVTAGIAGGGAAGIGGAAVASSYLDDTIYVHPTIKSYDIPTLKDLDCSSFETAP